jgi:hypothetical protein
MSIIGSCTKHVAAIPRHTGKSYIPLFTLYQLTWASGQIDAVYHTSIVLNDIEYYYGSGVQTCRAGATHHGRPMEVIKLGQTALPMEVILEYLESLKKIYTAEVRFA